MSTQACAPGESRSDSEGFEVERRRVRPLALPDPLPTDGPLVSIVIPAYNMAAYARACIESATNQTYRNIEIIVCDDCSTEPTADVMEEAAAGDPRVTIHRNEVNLGAPENFARGVALSHGPLVKFLNADDVLHPECVAHLVAAIEAEPGTVAAFCARVHIDRTGNPSAEGVASFAPVDLSFDGHRWGDYLLTQGGQAMGAPTCTLIRRHAVEAAVVAGREAAEFLGRSTSRIPLDQFWYLAACRLGQVAYLAAPLVHVRIHPASRSYAMGNSPDFYATGRYLVEWAKGIGFLQDPRAEAQALLLIVNTVLTSRHLFDLSKTDEADYTLRALASAWERVIEIENEIGADEVEAGLTPPLRPLWENRREQRELLANLRFSKASDDPLPTLPTDGPLVSIVIPAYNMAAYARECIESAMNQTYRNIEIVVCDDCSTEPTAGVMEEVAAGDPRVTIHRNEVNLGERDNTARVVECSNGPLVKFLNADDVLHPECVARMVAAIESEPGIVAVFSGVEHVEEDGTRRERQFVPLVDFDLISDGRELGELVLTTGRAIGTRSCALIRRAAVNEMLEAGRRAAEEVRRRIESPRLPVDQFWYLEVLRHGRIACLASPLARVRDHPHSQSNAIVNDLDWHTAHRYLVIWAKEKGYLQDPRAEALALGLFVFWIVKMRQHFDMSDQRKVTHLYGEVLDALERIEQIESEVGKEELAARTDAVLLGFWAELAELRPKLVSLLRSKVPVSP